MDIIEPETSRLRLRQWRKVDWPEFARLNADPRVMEYFPKCLTQDESNHMAQVIQSLIQQRGWGFWAVEEKATGKFCGFVGLHRPLALLPCSPCVEIGWRLAREHWGKGYATEAGQVSLEVAFKQLALDNIYSFTTLENRRSQAVMQRLHMTDTGKNFEHPDVPAGHPMREHVLYRLTRSEWLYHQKSDT